MGPLLLQVTFANLPLALTSIGAIVLAVGTSLRARHCVGRVVVILKGMLNVRRYHTSLAARLSPL
jgi:hypothetical protein